MHEAYEARLWSAHHAQLSAWIDGAFAAIGRGLDRFAGGDGGTHRIVAMIAAFAITLITFQGTAA